MRTVLLVAIAGIFCLMICSAGCIGDQTTDIMLGNQTIGKVTVTPVYDQLLSNSSLTDKFNVKIELFGMVFSKDGITKAEADSIVSDITTPSGELNTSFINASGLVTGNADDASRNLTEFMDSVFRMPLTNTNPNQTIDSLDWNGAFAGMQESVNRMTELLQG